MHGVYMLAAVPVGSAAQWLTLIVVGALGLILYKGGSPTAVSGLQDTNRELERQIKVRDGQVSALERVNAELRAEKDVTVAILPVIETLKLHEERAQERFERTLMVLDLIAQRLGADPNNNA